MGCGGWGGVGGGPCDYCVSPVQRIGFLGQGQDLGPVGTGDWGLGLGLDNKKYSPSPLTCPFDVRVG